MLNLEKAVKILNKPFFIIHGEEDFSVPVEEKKELFGLANMELTRF
jgi:dipeptidyl aminopeptidase/acylaminoacyl peptidase